MADLIHCITNPISMMQCANAVLSLGACPIMAEHPMEVRQITETASALLLNTGNISDSRMEAMEISYETALEKSIPIVIDAVGVACSDLRRDYVFKLLNKHPHHAKSFLVLKGNYSEIKALAVNSYKGKGVDADKSIEAGKMQEIAQKLAADLGTVILASGETDIVTDGGKTILVKAGTPMLGQITGTGCMLGAVCATFLAGEPRIEAVAGACEFFGNAGEKAYKKLYEKNGEVGAGSYLIGLLDSLSFEKYGETNEKNRQ
ncbi:hydroxyethylthiazole kinase [Butyrivibrio sp. DSM 10294]|uniref:hydroxyethylthiazole kinase n=1 Tax=Butyrivibrio sp. DSM 10294 TaxID=2972457 RepID=UPI00234E889D|nr:hydroxyethylthiazole kinase [Butyrivibrio sp. DSM 10294]MDC7292069.1 hydroxyethylthiazole kinase [Butyrivibrio sp. DSM 10294]